MQAELQAAKSGKGTKAPAKAPAKPGPPTSITTVKDAMAHAKLKTKVRISGGKDGYTLAEEQKTGKVACPTLEGVV